MIPNEKEHTIKRRKWRKRRKREKKEVKKVLRSRGKGQNIKKGEER